MKNPYIIELYSKDKSELNMVLSMIIHGRPGIGKTVLSRNIITSIKQQLDSEIFVITDNNEYDVFKPIDGIELITTLQKLVDFRSKVRSMLHARHSIKSSWTAATLQDSTIIPEFTPIFIFVELDHNSFFNFDNFCSEVLTSDFGSSKCLSKNISFIYNIKFVFIAQSLSALSTYIGGFRYFDENLLELKVNTTIIEIISEGVGFITSSHELYPNNMVSFNYLDDQFLIRNFV